MDPVIDIGDHAPEFSLPDLDGRDHSLSQRRGQLVLLNFWSAECPHSARTDAQLAKLREVWGDQVVVWSIASNANESIDLLRQVAVDRKLSPVLLDSEGDLADRFGAQTTPHCFLLDGAGRLRYAGAPDDVSLRQRESRRSYLAEAVGALLGGREPDPDRTPGYGCAIVRHQF